MILKEMNPLLGQEQNENIWYDPFPPLHLLLLLESHYQTNNAKNQYENRKLVCIFHVFFYTWKIQTSFLFLFSFHSWQCIIIYIWLLFVDLKVSFTHHSFIITTVQCYPACSWSQYSFWENCVCIVRKSRGIYKIILSLK